jgi:hypothetical protein
MPLSQRTEFILDIHFISWFQLQPHAPSCDISNRTTACSSSWNTLFPGLTNFRRISPCPHVTKIMAFKENYPSPALIKQYDLAQSRRILNWLIATVLARGKNIHIPSSLQAQKTVLDFFQRQIRKPPGSKSIPNQHKSNGQTYLWFGTRQASHPILFLRRHTR